MRLAKIAASLMLPATLPAFRRWPVAAVARRRVQRRCLVIAVLAQGHLDKNDLGLVGRLAPACIVPQTADHSYCRANQSNRKRSREVSAATETAAQPVSTGAARHRINARIESMRGLTCPYEVTATARDAVIRPHGPEPGRSRHRSAVIMIFS